MSRTTSPTGCSLSLAAYSGQSPTVFSVKHLHEDCVCKNWWRSSRLSQNCSVLWCECFQSRFGRGVLHNCGPGRGSFTEVLVDTEEESHFFWTDGEGNKKAASPNIPIINCELALTQTLHVRSTCPLLSLQLSCLGWHGQCPGSTSQPSGLLSLLVKSV